MMEVPIDDALAVNELTVQVAVDASWKEVGLAAARSCQEAPVSGPATRGNVK